MSNDLSWILFPDSPFLPNITSESLTAVTNLINNRRIAPGYAVASEAGQIGIFAHELHEKHTDLLAYQFEADALRLDMYLYGFTTPLMLILGGYLSNVRTLKEVIAIVCLSAREEILVQLNSYKARHLIKAIEIFQSAENRHPLTFVEPIFDLCRQDPFSHDEFFLIGLEAGLLVYKSLLGMIEPYRPSDS